MGINRLLAGSLVGLVLATGASAYDNYKTSIDFTIGQMDIEDNTGFNVGFDSKLEKNILEGSYGALYIGGGIGLEFFDPDDINSMNDKLGAIFDFYPTISYNIADTNFSINTMAGYSFGASGSEHFNGITWGVGAQYKFSDNWSAGVSYKQTDADFENYDDNTDLKRTALYFTRSF